jgi:hypothetical protein
MDELTLIMADFLRGQELIAEGNALVFQAFNDLLQYHRPPATRLCPTFGVVVPKAALQKGT